MTAPTMDPHNVDAERALLGILIGAPQLAESCGVRPGDLAPGSGHPELLSAILAVHEQTGTADPVLLVDELRRRDQLNQIGSADARGALYLHTLLAGRPPGTLGHFARLIREASIRRQLWTLGTRLAQIARSQTADLDDILDGASELSVQLGLVVDEPVDGDTPISGLSLIRDFINEPVAPYDWVIPGVIDRQDRVVLIAGEGTGKSWLARQLCVLLAAGRHPFMPKQVIRPRRTLLIDLENPVNGMRRQIRDLVGKVYAEGVDLGDRAWRWNQPAGMDLRAPADRALLARAIEMTRPDLVAIGPVYKAWRPRQGDNHESGPSEVGAAIDHLRERYGCAFWIEHHAPKGDGKSERPTDPLGSSYWKRWPEFGLALLREADNQDTNSYVLHRFRGDRDVRAWPDHLYKRASQWPWSADFDDQTKADLFAAIDEDNADTLPLPEGERA